MGDRSVTSTTASPLDSSSDSSDITNRILSSLCNSGDCRTRYIQSQNRLYFSEGKKIRYVQNPQNITTATKATLNTLFTANKTIYNFILTEDNSAIYYIKDDGKLYCYNLTSSRTECGGSGVEKTNLGPSAGAPGLAAGANQMTWKDSTTLFLSTYSGYIYEYHVP